ncbi:MAG TPA: hypothetical protein VFD06_10010 [Candidatus Polarisedimenticolia bacterium]|nr:hypothetical protein [Candidatus Polarisedimenticolia bacterium]
MDEKVVAHYQDGRTLRGTTQDFRPESESFHLLPSEGGGIPTMVRLTDLKALFYVKDYGYLRRQVERSRRFGSSAPGQKTIVEFRDGERLWGFTEEYTPGGHGFFFTPADPQENNVRIFVINTSVKQITFED